mmetsp:Transcript_22436/g.34023  ORF Transcript_22436/g.34023 Transcript_22436/m.34023 type:complete len:114 (+) Transcript_22436:1873-2214(+)
MTTITSAFLMVVSLCAIMMVVRFSVTRSLSRASWTTSSLSESNALVASSRRSNFGLPTKTLAIAILCFCPPLSCRPLSPTCVSNPSGKLMIKSYAFARLAAFSISSRLALSLP